MDVNNMIVQDVLNVIMDMIFKMKNATYILMVVIHIIYQEIVSIVKLHLNYMIKIAILI